MHRARAELYLGGYPGPGHRGTAGPAGEGHRGLDAHGTTGTMSSIPARAGSPDAIGQRSLVSTWSPRGLLGSGNLQWCPSLPGGTWGSFSFRQSGVGKSSWLLRWWTGSSAEQSNLYCTAASPATHTHPHGYISDTDTSINIIQIHIFSWLPGSLLSRKPPGILQGTGKAQGSWDSLGTREVTQGAPCPLHGSGCGTPCSVPQFPLWAAWLSPQAVPGPVALRAGTVVAVPRGAALHH